MPASATRRLGDLGGRALAPASPRRGTGVDRHAGLLPCLQPAVEVGEVVVADPLEGRRRESGELLGLLRSERLVTLIGTGGAGKARLALAVVAGADLTKIETVLFADLSAVHRVPGRDVP